MRSNIIVLALACLLAPGAPPLRGAETPPDAAKLVAAVLANQRTSGFVARAKVEARHGDDPPRIVQVMVKGRRQGPTAETMVVAMWPAALKGQAVVVRRRDHGAPSGFRFTPPEQVEQLARVDLDDPLFGTGLSIANLLETFWEWPDQKITGSARQGRDDCWILESRPGPAPARHPLVRCWIAKTKNLPVRTEKYARTGQPLTRITVNRTARRDDGGWSPAELTIEALDSNWRTTVTFSRGERGLTLPAADFSPAAVRQLSAGK